MLLGSLMVQSPAAPPITAKDVIGRMENKQFNAIFAHANSSVEKVLRLSWDVDVGNTTLNLLCTNKIKLQLFYE